MTSFNNSTQPNYQIKLLYDGECPLCLKEVNFLRKKDAGKGKVKFIDIASEDYSPEDNQGIDYETAMATIHAILPDGKVVTNVEVFRRTYEILGMGWIYAITKIPIIGFVADKVYGIWAKFRLQLTGRENLNTIVSLREKRFCESKEECQL